jgi:hypothetical protein
MPRGPPQKPGIVWLGTAEGAVWLKEETLTRSEIEIAKRLHVGPKTLRAARRRMGMPRFASFSDDTVDEAMFDLMRRPGGSLDMGAVDARGALASEGHLVQQQRIRASLSRIHVREGIVARVPMARAPFDAKGPDNVVSIDSTDKVRAARVMCMSHALT